MIFKKIFIKRFYLFLCMPLLSAVNFAECSALNVDYGFRSRWETVNLKSQKTIGTEETANALTAKLRLNLKYHLRESIQFFVQADHVLNVNGDQYSDGVNNNNYPVIADPAGTEMNQYRVKLGLWGNEIVLGRQRIVLGAARFIGDVGFRQNDQTYDALRLDRQVWSASKLTAAYIHNVNRIFGNDAGPSLSTGDSRFASQGGIRPLGQLGNHHVDAWLLHLNLDEWQSMEFDLYAYNTHNYHFSAFSNRTTGAQATYREKLAHIKIVASGELAYQKQQAIESDWIPYQKLSASVEWHGFELGVRYERLAEQKGTAFSTPLATLHKFQGWADQFLTTPAEGLRDSSISFKWTNRPWLIDIRYHEFKTDLESMTVANEIDFDLIYRLTRKQEIKLRYANFKTEKNQSIRTEDVEKIFLMYTYNI